MALPAKTEPLRVCLDSDVIIAGLMSRGGASHALLVLGEVGLFTLIVPSAAIDEVARNLGRLLPEALPLFQQFADLPAVRVYTPSARDVAAATGHADTKDVPILAAALGSASRFLITHNLRHFRARAAIRVVKPGILVGEARARLATLGE